MNGLTALAADGFNLAQTANLNLCLSALRSALKRSMSLPGLVCLFGPSGYGKSCAAAWVAGREGAFYVQARSVWSRKHFLQAVLREMGLPTKGTIAELADRVAEELAARGKPLIIDEADHLVDRGAVELVRDLYEAGGMPLVLIGEEGLPNKLKRYERVHERVLQWIPAQPVCLGDAKALAALYGQGVVFTDDLLSHLVEQAHGSARRVSVNLEWLAEKAKANGCSQLELKDLKRLKLELYTGQAPKRRLL